MSDQNELNLEGYPIPVIAEGLLRVELNRDSAFAKAVAAAGVDVLDLPTDERRKMFGARVRILRQLYGLSCPELAKRIGLSPQMINKVEAGEREFSIPSLIRLARCFNVTCDYLVGND